MDNIGTYDILAFGNIVSFQVYPSIVIGTKFSNVKVLGLLDKETANMWIDTESMHANVFPIVRSQGGNMPDNADDYQYLKIKHLSNGKNSVIGLPWIIESSITVERSGTFILTMENVNAAKRIIILDALAANGIRVASEKYLKELPQENP